MNIFTKKRLYVAALFAATIAHIGSTETRWIAVLNTSETPMSLSIDNGRTKVNKSLDPNQLEKFEIKPDSFWDPRNLHYVTHNEEIYVSVDGKKLDPFEATKMNTYIALSSDNNAHEDPEGHTMKLSSKETDEDSLAAVAVETPLPELNAFTSKIKKIYIDNKEHIDPLAKKAANSLMDKAADKFLNSSEEERKELAEEEISVTKDEDGDLLFKDEDGDIIFELED